MTIELIRHGVTAWVAEKRYQGHTDIPLSPEGMAMLKSSDEVPGRIYVSPLTRARQSADIIFPSQEKIIINDLSEMCFGVFEGRTADEMADDPEYRRWVDGWCLGRCPGGEDKAGFDDRVRPAFEGIVNKELSSGCRKISFVVHGGVIMSLMEAFADEKKNFYEWYIQPGCGYLLDTDKWLTDHVLRYCGSTEHTAVSANKHPADTHISNNNKNIMDR